MVDQSSKLQKMENSINEILIKVMAIEQKQKRVQKKELSAYEKHKQLTDKLC